MREALNPSSSPSYLSSAASPHPPRPSFSRPQPSTPGKRSLTCLRMHGSPVDHPSRSISGTRGEALCLSISNGSSGLVTGLMRYWTWDLTRRGGMLQMARAIVQLYPYLPAARAALVPSFFRSCSPAPDLRVKSSEERVHATSGFILGYVFMCCATYGAQALEGGSPAASAAGAEHRCGAHVAMDSQGKGIFDGTLFPQATMTASGVG